MALRPKSPVTGWGRGLEAGFEFALSVLIGTAVGYYLDGWLGTRPWLMLVFLGLGFAAGFRSLLRRLPSPDAGADAQADAGRKDPEP